MNKFTNIGIFCILILLITSGDVFAQRQVRASATLTITVTAPPDNTPPVIHNCPSDIVVYTGTGSTNCSAQVSWTAPTATDNNRISSFSSNHQPGATFPVGTTTVTYTATDPAENITTCSFNVTVIDNTLPHISVSLSPTLLWPPNHVMVDITATVNISDNCSGSGLNYVLESITSNEADDGYGDGDFPNDIQNANYHTADTHFSLRRERSGRGSDRIYTVTYKVTDASGNFREATATVTVPHNR